jgi:hypothetical protein
MLRIALWGAGNVIYLSRYAKWNITLKKLAKYWTENRISHIIIFKEKNMWKKLFFLLFSLYGLISVSSEEPLLGSNLSEYIYSISTHQNKSVDHNLRSPAGAPCMDVNCTFAACYSLNYPKSGPKKINGRYVVLKNPPNFLDNYWKHVFVSANDGIINAVKYYYDYHKDNTSLGHAQALYNKILTELRQAGYLIKECSLNDGTIVLVCAERTNDFFTIHWLSSISNHFVINHYDKEYYTLTFYNYDGKNIPQMVVNK